MIKVFAFAAALLCASSAIAEQPSLSTFERVLVPVFLNRELPGAYGAIWATDFVARNNADAPAFIFQTVCVFTCECVLGECGTVPTPPDSLVTPFLQTEGPFIGVFLYAERSIAPSLSFHLEVRDAARYPRGMGTELPVVRESGFLTGPSELLNVPVDASTRLLLRLYAISSETGSGEVRVRIFPLETAAVLSERVVSILPPPRREFIPGPDELLSYPGLLELPLGDMVAQATGPVRIELRPVDPTLVYWAFVSATDNVTQHVTTITPQ